MGSVGKSIALPGVERADPESIAAVEAFLAKASGGPVELGCVLTATGLLGRYVAAIARARAITLGPLICVASRPKIPHPLPEVETALERYNSLFVHECVHVWQYRREGALNFLRQYLKSYFSGIWVRGSVDRNARLSSYLAIPYESEAFRLEREWEKSNGRPR